MSIDSMAVKLGGSLPTTSSRASGSESEVAIVDFQAAPTATASSAGAALALSADAASVLDTGPLSLDPAFAQLLELSEQQYGAVEAAAPVSAAPGKLPAELLDVAAEPADPAQGATTEQGNAAVAAAVAQATYGSLDTAAGPSLPAASADALRQGRVLLIQQPVLRPAQLTATAPVGELGIAATVQTRVDMTAVLEMPGAATVPVASASESGATIQAGSSMAPVGSAQSAASASNTAPVEGVLSPDDPAFPEEFAARVGWMLERGQEQATVRLDPPRLGSMTIQIALSDEVARVQILLTSPLAREVVDNSLLQLRQMFADAGLSLGDVNVSGGGGQSGGDSQQPGSRAALPADSERSEISSSRVRSGTSMIDTFA